MDPMSEEIFSDGDLNTDDYDFTPTPGDEIVLEYEDDSGEIDYDETELFGDVIEKKEKKFESKTVEDLIKEKKDTILELSETFGIPFSVCGALLRAYQWKTEK